MSETQGLDYEAAHQMYLNGPWDDDSDPDHERQWTLRVYTKAIVDAALKGLPPCGNAAHADLTSPETIEWCERHDSPRIHDSVFCDYSLENEYCVTPCADIVKVAVLRSVEEQDHV